MVVIVVVMVMAIFRRVNAEPSICSRHKKQNQNPLLHFQLKVRKKTEDEKPRFVDFIAS